MYQNGDIVFDMLYREVFKYDHKTDKHVVLSEPTRFRLANDEEIERLKQSGTDYLTIQP